MSYLDGAEATQSGQNLAVDLHGEQERRVIKHPSPLSSLGTNAGYKGNRKCLIKEVNEWKGGLQLGCVAMSLLMLPWGK